MIVDFYLNGDIYKDLIVQEYVKYINDGCIKLDCTTSKKRKWNLSKKSELIDSILKGYPTNPFYLLKKDGRYECIDGNMRSLTLVEFINDEFALTGMDDEELNGKYFSELDEDSLSMICSALLKVIILQNRNEKELGEIIERLDL
ncbi:MAG: DUF262 domain-containing protein [Butyrivibrio sp.]|nr:DUF262 domain-containing protein [Butyrivibrio sp.]